MLGGGNTKAQDFCSRLKKYDFNFFVGVPCSTFKSTIDYLLSDPEVRYIPATREDEALGIATGASVAGNKSAVIMQNSGLGNSVGALTSLPLLYKIPMLLLISWRGYLGMDAPEHRIMGEKTLVLLEDIGIPTFVLEGDLEGVISPAVDIMREKQIPTAVIVRKGVIE